MTGAQITAAIGSTVAIVFLLMLWVVRARVEKEITVAIIAAAGTLLVSVIVVAVTQYNAKLVEVAEQHRLKKTEVYSEFGDLVFQIFQMIKIADRTDLTEEEKLTSQTAAESDLQSRYSSFSKKLLLWGSPEVIHKWLAFREHARKSQIESDPQKALAMAFQNLLFMDDVFRAMREDLELSNQGLGEGDLVKAFLADPEILDPHLGTR